MAFDVFEKISELETKVYLLETELQEKTELIQTLRERNDYLEAQFSKTTNNDIPDNRTFYEPKSGSYYTYDPETGQYTRENRTEIIVLENPNPINAKEQTPCPPLNCEEKSKLPTESDENVASNGAEICGTCRCTSQTAKQSALQDAGIHRLGQSSKTAGSSSPCAEHHEISAGALLYPPTLRLVVLSADSAPDGTVYTLTSKECSEGWGCIGRSSAFCTSVNFPLDNRVAPIHCEMIYDDSNRVYTILNRDSPSGTRLNGEKLSRGEQRLLRHADILRLASVRLLLHVHEGKEVCQQCDGSLIQPVATEEKVEPDDAREGGDQCITVGRLEKERQATLLRMKNKYGLKHSLQDVASKIKTQYVDRAARRRVLEKESPSSLDKVPESVDGLRVRRIVNTRQHEKNYGQGAKMLCKMGWKPGQGLGKLNTGRLEPVNVKKRYNALAGFGAEVNESQHDVRRPHDRERSRCLEITRERYRCAK